jgi:hypothetical protein
LNGRRAVWGIQESVSAGTARYTAPRQATVLTPILVISSELQPVARKYSIKASCGVLALWSATARFPEIT